MSDRRLFASALPEQGGLVALSPDAARHARVLRLSIGDPVRLYDGDGREAAARVVELDGDRMTCEAEPAHATAPASGARVVLVQALPKGDKLDTIVRMGVELGAAAFHLADSERSIAKLDARRAPARIARLSRIAREAARQSGRTIVPEVHPPQALVEVCKKAPEHAQRVVLWERATVDLRDALAAPADEVWLVVGPEGGLSEAEVAALRAIGYRDARLSDAILRVETAAPVAVALALELIAARRIP